MVRAHRAAHHFGLTVVAAALLLIAFPAAELRSAEPKPDKSAESGQLEITRADLAAAFLQLETVYFANPPQGKRRADTNTAFDRATLAFFTGRNAEAIQAIDAITESLVPTDVPLPAARVVGSLKAVVEPPVWIAGSTKPATCRVVSIYPSPTPLTLDLTLRLVDKDNRVVLERPVKLDVGPEIKVDESCPLDLSSGAIGPGQYRLELKPAESGPAIVGRVNVVAGKSLDEQRVANEQRLAELKPASPALEQALASCRARNELLNDHPSVVNSAQFLADLNGLAQEVAKEIDALSAGQDPYAGRRGDYWRVLKAGDGTLPFRVFAPEVADASKPLPLLVVLHGAGGDENMFFEAYGAGVIKKLAQQHGLLVASPLTYAFGSNVKKLDALVAALAHDYPIDRERVYVLGHSMGAGMTAALARGNQDKIAAACCIAGGRFAFQPNTPPILVISPELDIVVPAKSLQASATKAASDGLPLELKILPDEGHTLAVGTALPDAIAWLLQHRSKAPQ